MSVSEFLWQVQVPATIDCCRIPEGWDSIGLADRNAVFAHYMQAEAVTREVSLCWEDCISGGGFLALDIDPFSIKRQTRQRMWQPQTVEECQTQFGEFKVLPGWPDRFTDQQIAAILADPSYCVFFVEDETPSKRGKGVIVFERSLEVDFEMASYSVGVHFCHVEGGNMNKAALLSGLCSQMIVDTETFLTALKATSFNGGHMFDFSYLPSHEFEAMSDILERLPEIVESEIFQVNNDHSGPQI